jgi:hypothetical protein
MVYVGNSPQQSSNGSSGRLTDYGVYGGSGALNNLLGGKYSEKNLYMVIVPKPVLIYL